MTLLRPQNSLHYRCLSCGAEFRFAAISGPVAQPHLAIACACPFCGDTGIKLVPDWVSERST